MKKAHEIISNLPYFIVGYWVFFYIIGKTDFYHKYMLLIDDLDFIPVGVCLFHFVLNLAFKWVDYSLVKIVLICTMIMICGMYKLRDAVSDLIYWNLYLHILFGGISIAVFTYFLSKNE
jgi:hypothetical protein